MNTKTILGLSLAATFAVSMMVPALATEHDFFNVQDGGVSQTPGSYHATIDAVDDIPITAEQGVLGGYAWFVTGNNDWAVFAVTTHNAGEINPDDDANPVNDVRDSKQNPDSWHAHLVNVDGNLCITEVSDITTAGIGVIDGDMNVNVAKSKIGGTLDDVPAAGFEIAPFQAICDGKHPLQLQVQFVP